MPRHRDIAFCIKMLLQVLSLIKYQPHLFDDQVDSSEWEFVAKLWGVITERLLHGTDLRLKWGDTHLTVHDTVSDLLLKVDLRILHDRIQQRHNTETDIGVFEAAEEVPGVGKYTADRCMVLIEIKAVIDRFILDGCLIDSMDSLQVCGLEIHFGTTIDKKSLSNLCKYLDLAFHLLCFRDRCVEISNQFEDHLINARSKKTSSKKTNHELPDDN